MGSVIRWLLGTTGSAICLMRCLTGPGAQSLIEFAHAVDFSREAFDDDRTLVAMWPRKQVPCKAGRHSRAPGSPSGVGDLR